MSAFCVCILNGYIMKGEGRGGEQSGNSAVLIYYGSGLFRFSRDSNGFQKQLSQQQIPGCPQGDGARKTSGVCQGQPSLNCPHAANFPSRLQWFPQTAATHTATHVGVNTQCNPPSRHYINGRTYLLRRGHVIEKPPMFVICQHKQGAVPFEPPPHGLVHVFHQPFAFAH